MVTPQMVALARIEGLGARRPPRQGLGSLWNPFTWGEEYQGGTGAPVGSALHTWVLQKYNVDYNAANPAYQANLYAAWMAETKPQTVQAAAAVAAAESPVPTGSTGPVSWGTVLKGTQELASDITKAVGDVIGALLGGVGKQLGLPKLPKIGKYVKYVKWGAIGLGGLWLYGFVRRATKG